MRSSQGRRKGTDFSLGKFNACGDRQIVQEIPNAFSPVVFSPQVPVYWNENLSLLSG
jgi:hypothetical protein